VVWYPRLDLDNHLQLCTWPGPPLLEYRKETDEKLGVEGDIRGRLG